MLNKKNNKENKEIPFVGEDNEAMTSVLIRSVQMKNVKLF